MWLAPISARRRKSSERSLAIYRRVFLSLSLSLSLSLASKCVEVFSRTVARRRRRRRRGTSVPPIYTSTARGSSLFSQSSCILLRARAALRVRLCVFLSFFICLCARKRERDARLLRSRGKDQAAQSLECRDRKKSAKCRIRRE